MLVAIKGILFFVGIAAFWTITDIIYEYTEWDYFNKTFMAKWKRIVLISLVILLEIPLFVQFMFFLGSID